MAILGCEFSWGLAAAIGNLTTVVTGYVEWLGYSEVVIALVPALYWAFHSLTQPLSPRLIPSSGNVKRRVTLFFGAGILCLTAMGILLSVFPLAAWARGLLLAGCLIAFISFVGIGDPQYMAIVYRAVPDHQRGRFFGARALALGIGGVLGSLILNLIFTSRESPANFHRAFLASGIIFLAVIVSFGLYRDRNPEAGSTEARPSVLPHLAGLTRKVLRNRLLLMFLLVDSLFLIAVLGGFPLYAVYIKGILGGSEDIYAQLTPVYWVANCVLAPAMGWWADRAGYRTVMLAVIACFCLGTAMLIYTGGGFWYYLFAYFLASVWFPGMIVVSFNLAQVCARDLKPMETMIAISVALMPVRLLSPVLIGGLMKVGLHSFALILCTALTVAAAVVLVVGLKEEDLRREYPFTPPGAPKESSGEGDERAGP